MHDTSVPNLSVWSGLAAPLCCLANKSQARQCSESLQSALEANLNGPGSMIYQTVWKPHTTPLGRQIYRRRASARRTSDSEHSLVPSGWPSPTTSDTRSYSETALTIWLGGKTTNGHGMDLNMAGQLSGWPSPTVGNAAGSQMAKGASTTGRRPDGSKATVSLNAVAQASGWPTPMAGTPAQNGNNEAGNNDSSRKTVALSGWPTPTSRDHKDGKECPNVPLNALLGRVAWLTANPQAARITADGTMLTGCSAGMESGGQLNPAFSGWLQGFPEACAMQRSQPACAKHQRSPARDAPARVWERNRAASRRAVYQGV